MEYYLRRNELLSLEKTRGNLKWTSVSERSQWKGHTLYDSSSTSHSGKDMTTETVKGPVVARSGQWQVERGCSGQWDCSAWHYNGKSCQWTSVQTHRTYTKGGPQCKAPMQDDNDVTVLVHLLSQMCHSGGAEGYWGGCAHEEGIWEIFILASQFCC